MKLLTKRIGVLGHGIEGASLEQFLKSRRVRDLKVYDENQEGFSDFSHISDRDVLFRSPGVSPHHPALQSFTGKVMSNADLFLSLCPTKKILGITGTKGKGTCSSLVSRMFQEANDTVFLLGNIGHPFFDDLPDIRTRDVVIAELSSFQLWDCETSPQIALLLRMSEDHLEIHRDAEEYHDAKKNIFRHQKSGGHVVYNIDCPIVRGMVDEVDKNRLVPFSTKRALEMGAFLRKGNFIWKNEAGEEEVIATTEEVLLPGRHNYENILAAIAGSKMLNVKTLPIKTAISKFRGLPFRFQLTARTRDNIHFWNDSYATNPSATLAALRNISDPMIAVVGGRDKNMNWEHLRSEIEKKENLKMVLAIGETGKVLAKSLPEKVRYVENIEGVISALPEFLEEGDHVLFSPASASFDQFANAVDRGEKWNAAVTAFLKTRSL